MRRKSTTSVLVINSMLFMALSKKISSLLPTGASTQRHVLRELCKPREQLTQTLEATQGEHCKLSAELAAAGVTAAACYSQVTKQLYDLIQFEACLRTNPDSCKGTKTMLSEGSMFARHTWVQRWRRVHAALGNHGLLHCGDSHDAVHHALLHTRSHCKVSV